jgi:hypothetical protein
LFGAFVWLSVLAAADFDLAPVLGLLSTLDALVAAAGLVIFDFAIFFLMFSVFDGDCLCINRNINANI